jgi:hypothetical protein
MSTIPDSGGEDPGAKAHFPSRESVAILDESRSRFGSESSVLRIKSVGFAGPKSQKSSVFPEEERSIAIERFSQVRSRSWDSPGKLAKI